MADLRQVLETPLPPPALPAFPVDCDDEVHPRVIYLEASKAVVVSQWTSMLDLVQRPLDAEGVNGRCE